MSVYGHGPSPREQSVLDLLEQGLELQDIATRLDLSVTYVRDIGSRLSGSWAENNRIEAQIRKATIAHGKLLAATGQRYT